MPASLSSVLQGPAAVEAHVEKAAAAATAAPLEAAASAAAPAVAQAVAPQPAQPTPAVRVEAAHKQLKSYLPGELCEAFRVQGLKHDLYDWQVHSFFFLFFFSFISFFSFFISSFSFSCFSLWVQVMLLWRSSHSSTAAKLVAVDTLAVYV